MTTIREDILAAGPKEVRTPNMTVITHNPSEIARITERKLAPLPSLCSMGGCRTRPNAYRYQPFVEQYEEGYPNRYGDPR